MKFRIAPPALFIALGLTLGTASAKDPELLSLTMEHFRDTATVKSDPGGNAATISTEKGFVEHTGLLRTVSNDEFLKAVIDDKTHQKSYAVDVSVSYIGRWRTYETANYQATSGPKSVATVQLGRDVTNCAAGNCVYTEHVAFPVDEELLRQLAAGYVPRKPTVWRYQLIAKQGADYAGGLSNAEIAGFLAKVDEYTGASSTAQPVRMAPPSPAAEPARAAQPAPAAPPVSPAAAGAPPSSPAAPALPAAAGAAAMPAAPANAPGAPNRLDLGVWGMPVAASAKQPARAGILIIGVNADSVADASGIIVGDILYELGGRPLKGLADLQNAIAASTPNSAVTIKLYRGTSAMVVTAKFR